MLKIKKQTLFLAAIILLLLHPYYLYILNTFGSFQAVLSISSIVILAYCSKKIVLRRELLPFVLLILWFILDNYELRVMHSGVNTIVYYIVLLIAVILLSQTTVWTSKMPAIMTGLSLPHAIATILILIIPSLYSLIRPFIAAENILYAGYQTGLTGHYSTNGIYLANGVIACTAVLISDVISRKKISKKYFALLIVMSFALLLTAKRGPLLFSILAILITFFVSDPSRFEKKLYRFVGIAVFAVTGFIIAAGIIPELQRIIERFNVSGSALTSGREVMYGLAFKMFFMDIVFGTGFGSYRYAYHSVLGRVDGQFLNSHNVYIQLLAENGIIGLILFLTFTISVFIKTYKIIRKLNKSQEKDLEIAPVILSFAYQVFFLMYCVTGNPLYDSMTFYPYCILCAVVFAYSGYIRGKERRSK